MISARKFTADAQTQNYFTNTQTHIHLNSGLKRRHAIRCKRTPNIYIEHIFIFIFLKYKNIETAQRFKDALNDTGLNPITAGKTTMRNGGKLMPQIPALITAG